VKPSTPARRRVNYKRDRSPTLPTTSTRDPTNNPEKTGGRYIDLLQKESRRIDRKEKHTPPPLPRSTE